MKTLIGCLSLVAVLALALAAGTYAFVYRPIAAHVTDFRAAIAEIQEAVALESQVANTQPFDAPEDGLLTREQVERYVAVQQAVTAAASSERTALRQKYDELRSLGGDGSGSIPSPGVFVATLGAFADALRATKQVQVAALDDAGFSMDEYRWVQRTVLASLGVSVLPADLAALRDLDLRRLKDARGLGGAVEPQDEDKAADANVALVSKHRDHLDEWASMAVLGL